jgi:NADH-quinone oxidoreductase subunit C
MSGQVEILASALNEALGERAKAVASLPGELTYETTAADLVSVARTLRDDARLRFEVLIDVAGIDYLTYGQDEWKTDSATRSGFSRAVARTSLPASQQLDDATTLDAPSPRRFAVAYQLLSISHNQRLMLKVWCEGEVEPTVDSLVEVWPSANWFEREAYDLFGILFRGHPDLRRLLTDYGFIGHPFRKDFPLIGNVEVRYDAQQKRVVYEPVSIEPRTLVPRVIRHDNRYDAALKAPAPAPTPAPAAPPPAKVIL